MGWFKDLFKKQEEPQEEYPEVVVQAPPPSPPPKPVPQAFRCNGCGRRGFDVGESVCPSCNKKFCQVCMNPARHTCRGKRSH